MLEWLNVKDEVAKSVILVITKVTHDDEDLSMLLKEKSKQLQKNMVNGAALFEYIVASGRYASFSRPDGSDGDKTTLNRARTRIWNILNNI